MQNTAYIFIGRYGAGKGTQAKLLLDALKRNRPDRPVLYLETGAKFRNFIAGDNYTSRLSKDGVDKGHLMPEFMP